MRVPLDEKKLRKLNNAQAQKIWEQAYTVGQISLALGAHQLDAALRLRDFLRNFRSLHRRYPMRNPALLQLMSCCRIILRKDGTVILERKRISVKTIGTRMFLQSTPVHDAIIPVTRSDKVMRIFTNEGKNTCNAE